MIQVKYKTEPFKRDNKEILVKVWKTCCTLFYSFIFYSDARLNKWNSKEIIPVYICFCGSVFFLNGLDWFILNLSGSKIKHFPLIAMDLLAFSSFPSTWKDWRAIINRKMSFVPSKIRKIRKSRITFSTPWKELGFGLNFNNNSELVIGES